MQNYFVKTKNKMSVLLEMLHEQLLDYSNQLKEVEAEMIRKYKAGEDYSEDLKKASGLKLMKEECVRMMMVKRGI